MFTHLQSRHTMLTMRIVHTGNLCVLEHNQGQALVISPLEAAGLFERHSSLESSFPSLSFHTYLLSTIHVKGLLNKNLCFLGFFPVHFFFILFS